jgi:hypothetical protein
MNHDNLIVEYKDSIEELRAALIDEAKIRKAYTRRFVIYARHKELETGVSWEEAQNMIESEFKTLGMAHYMGVVEAKKNVTKLQKRSIKLINDLKAKLGREGLQLDANHAIPDSTKKLVRRDLEERASKIASVYTNSLYRLDSRYDDIAPDSIADAYGKEVREPDLHAAYLATKSATPGKKGGRKSGYNRNKPRCKSKQKKQKTKNKKQKQKTKNKKQKTKGRR